MADNENTNPEILLNQSELYSYLGTGGGNINYSSLGGKPTINGHLVEGDKTGADYGLVDVSNLINVIYPVGSIYMSMNSTSPSTLFSGTTWEPIYGKFLVSTSGSQEIETESLDLTLNKPADAYILTPQQIAQQLEIRMKQIYAAIMSGNFAALNSHAHITLLSRDDLKLRTKITLTFKLSNSSTYSATFTVGNPELKIVSTNAGPIVLMNYYRNYDNRTIIFLLWAHDDVYTHGLMLQTISYNTAQVFKLNAGNTGGYTETIVAEHQHNIYSDKCKTNKNTISHSHGPRDSHSTHFLTRNSNAINEKNSEVAVGGNTPKDAWHGRIRLNDNSKGKWYAWMSLVKNGLYSMARTGETSVSHEHTVSGVTENTGKKVGFEVEASNFPPYLVVYMWKRTE